MKLHERLKSLRDESGMNQKEFAASLKIEATKYNKWENGKYSPGYDDLVYLSKELGVTTDYLLGVSNHKTIKSASALVSSFNDMLAQIEQMDGGEYFISNLNSILRATSLSKDIYENVYALMGNLGDLVGATELMINEYCHKPNANERMNDYIRYADIEYKCRERSLMCIKLIYSDMTSMAAGKMLADKNDIDGVLTQTLTNMLLGVMEPDEWFNTIKQMVNREKEVDENGEEA